MQKQSSPPQLSLFFLISAVATFASSVINWVASNWEQFSRLQKLYGMQGIVAVCFCGTMYFFYQAQKHPESAMAQHKKSAAFFCLAMSFGACLLSLGKVTKQGQTLGNFLRGGRWCSCRCYGLRLIWLRLFC